MWKDSNIFKGAIEAAKNHMARAKEGRELLAQGKPLSDMKTPILGLDSGDNNRRRADFLEEIQTFDDEKLQWVYNNYLTQLNHRINSPDAGYSELLWNRNAFLDEFERRKLTPPTEV